MATEPRGPQIFTVANGFTYARLVLLPFVIAGITTHHGWLTLIGMVVVWITDLVDGRLARRMGQGGSPFGKTLDSTIDFILIYGLFIAFYAAGRISTWQFAFLYLAMLAILSLQMTSAARGGEAGGDAHSEGQPLVAGPVLPASVRRAEGPRQRGC